MATPQTLPLKLVLVIDDDPNIHALARHALRETADVVACATATEGLSVLATRPFDLVLLDLGLPDIHGLDVLSRLRQAGQQTRVVVITADDTSESLLRAISENTYLYLRKPFTMDQLAAVAERALAAAPEPEIHVLSAKREWLELSIPCTRDAAERIEQFVRQLSSDLALDLLEPVALAFRELLMNAVEWGGGLDPQRRVRISCLRGARLLLYRIADPGPGFNFDGLLHSAAVNPEGVLGSTAERDRKGIRPGGLGVLMVRAIADELIYNQAQNEVVLVKYLDTLKPAP
jgi:CheY-like chemotaxis protein/anti-sigma regulatory factor (Ser/Thr protein kinase)